MKITHKPITALIFVLTALTNTAITHAGTDQIKLPTETAQLRYSELSGYALAQKKCVICHSLDYISYQPPKMNKAQWTQEVIKMQHTYGAPLSDSENKSIGAYLAVAYGTAKASDAEVLAASNAPELFAANAAEASDPSDIQALLNKHACFGCHDIDKNLIGPAFNSVASKYKNDPQTKAKLASSIKNGRVGQWGQIPMPPFNNLSQIQAEALAEFVLKQK